VHYIRPFACVSGVQKTFEKGLFFLTLKRLVSCSQKGLIAQNKGKEEKDKRGQRAPEPIKISSRDLLAFFHIPFLHFLT
jgi:hypothetical protein